MSWPPLDHVVVELEDIASGLGVFTAHTNIAADVNGCIGELFHICKTIRLLQSARLDRAYLRYTDGHTSDVNVVIRSLQFTSSACRHAFGKLPRSLSHELVWFELQDSFNGEGYELETRLTLCKDFIDWIYDLCIGHARPDSEFAAIRTKVRTLEATQRYQSEQLRGPGQARPSRRPSMSRRRISFTHVNAPGAAPVPPAPMPPEVPLSPTWSSSSAQTFSTNQTFATGSSSQRAQHWAERILDGGHGMTAFRGSRDITECFGRHEPMVMNLLLGEGWQKMFEISVDHSPHVRISLHLRPVDSRARILYHDRDLAYMCCMPLNALSLRRKGSLLQFVRVNINTRQTDLWANVKFTCYERMTLFYCTYKAMKMQDAVEYHEEMEDLFNYDSAYEDLCFSGTLHAGEGKLHALRLFRDFETGALRLEAREACRGRMKRCPIWTAFISDNVGQRGFIVEMTNTRLGLKSVKPYIFTNLYSPPVHRTGRLILDFAHPDDAMTFIENWESITEDA